MTQTSFFALRKDLITLITDAESGGILNYVETGVFPTPTFDRIVSGTMIPQLGTATADSAVNSANYLVTNPDEKVDFRHIEVREGAWRAQQRYAVDQLVNSNTITFRPGGARHDNFILHGMFGTVWDTPVAKEMMRRFRKAIRRHFTKVKSFYVGPDAHQAFLRGVRLTLSTQTPPDFDLTP